MTDVPLCAFNPISAFIDAQRQRFTNADNNRFAIGFGKIVRYQKFLALILARHQPDIEMIRERLTTAKGEKVMVLFSEIQADDTAEELRRQFLYDRCHLDIETFYLVAKILLDWVSRNLEFYFGQARGLALDSHDDLTKNLLKYRQAKKLTEVPCALLDAAKRLKADISDFRDYQIAHNKKFNVISGIHVMESGPILNMNSFVFGDPAKMKKKPEPLPLTIPMPDLWTHLTEYLAQVAAYLTENEDKTKFEIRS